MNPAPSASFAGGVGVENVVLDCVAATCNEYPPATGSAVCGPILVEGVVQDLAAAVCVHAAPFAGCSIAINQRVPHGQTARGIVDRPTILSGSIAI